MSKDMLGVAVRKLVTLPAETLGIVCDLLEKLSDPNWVVETKRFLRKENPWKDSAARNEFIHDKRNDGWELVEDVPRTEFSIPNLELISFLKGSEDWILGEALRERAKELNANLGQHDAEYLLEHQSEIPEELRKFYLVFPGTVWRRPDCVLGVPCLAWAGGRWVLGWGWLGDVWYSGAHLIRLSA